MTNDNTRKAVLIIKNQKIIRLLSSFIKTEILRLLIRKSMTETQLSKVLDLTKSAVGYHLQPLKKAGLIKIDRYETGEHGISKYYSTTANLFIVDPDYIPNDVKRYFLETQMIYIEGMLSAFQLLGKIEEVSSEDLEALANDILRELKIVGQKHISEIAKAGHAEFLRTKIYSEAIENLINRKKYQKIFQNIFNLKKEKNTELDLH